MKEKYLKVATPEQWDYWLTLKTDANASYKYDDWHVKELVKLETKNDGLSCLFCKVYKKVIKRKTKYKKEVFELDCKSCMPGHNAGAPCLNIPWNERVDMAIERLEKAGLWDESI